MPAVKSGLSENEGYLSLLPRSGELCFGRNEPDVRGQYLNTLVTIGGIVAPDSELARKAAALAVQAHSKVLLNHVHRTWWFAEFIGKKREMKYDRELVYLASLLHDLGLRRITPPTSASKLMAPMPRASFYRPTSIQRRKPT